MSDVSNKPPDAAEFIQRALRLSGDVEEVRSYYDDWAQHYDSTVSEEAYTGPQQMRWVVQDLVSRGLLSPERTLNIMDAGCGTGLVGRCLQGDGYRHIDGFDLSEEMIVLASSYDSYQTLKGGIGIAEADQHFVTKAYDLVISCGVFTSGHVGPEALADLARLAKRGGRIIVNTRISYAEGYAFEKVVASLGTQGLLKQVTVYQNQPYTADENAHYWVYEVL